MSRKERAIAAIRHAIAAACAVRRRPPGVEYSRRWGLQLEGLLRAAAQERSGLAERVLAGVLLAVAIAGAVLIPRLLVGPTPRHELGVGAPSMTVPPVVLAPGVPKQKSQPQAAAGPRNHATHDRVVPSASASQPSAPATSPAAHRPPATQSRPHAQPQPHSQPQPTIHALTPISLASGATTCDGTYSGTGKDVVVPSGATCVLVDGTVITHDLTVSPGGTLIDPAVTIGHDLVAHSPAGISIDGDSVGHDLRIEGLSGSAGGPNRICNTKVGHDLVVQGGLASAGPFAVGGGCPDGGNTVGHDLVVGHNANTVALAGNSVGHDLRVDGATASHSAPPKRHAPAPPHPAPKPKPPKPHHEPKPPKPHHEPKLPEPPKQHDKPKPHPDHAKPAHASPPPKPHPDHPKPPQSPPPKPGHEAEPHGHGHGH
jgi:hypothetical protein